MSFTIPRRLLLRGPIKKITKPIYECESQIYKTNYHQ